MKGWYGKPIALSGVPGNVYVGADGDFCGSIRNGYEATGLDYVEEAFTRLARKFNFDASERLAQFGSGFSSINDLITQAAKPAQRRKYPFYKIGVAGSANAQTTSLWQSSNYPGAGAAGSASPGGRIPDNTTTGCMPFINPGTGTQHFVAGYVTANIINSSLLLYDRIFDVAKTMNSTATESVTGVPTRYTSSTAGAVDSAENNFLFMECQTVLPATAHNWTVCQYTNQAGTTSQTLPSVTGISSCAAQRLDMPVNNWFAPLASGDNGIQALTQMQCSATVATGAINFVMGHPIAWMACPILSVMSIADGVTSAFSFERVFDSACLALLEPIRPTTTAATYQGTFVTVSGS